MSVPLDLEALVAKVEAFLQKFADFDPAQILADLQTLQTAVKALEAAAPKPVASVPQPPAAQN